MVAAARPDLAGRVRVVADRLLDSEPLLGAGTRTREGAFRRRSCCLIYRAAPGGSGALCGDCALRR
jgi:ferric iron reductase protein FhuF